MDDRRIHQLSPSLVNRIAAGEVIERPASVVKELVENALDAGASSITVEIEDGGREVIRVIDDGCGMAPDDLPLAFAEHATSKLSCDDDLFRIQTMGFRGEALASIGAVSHARIISRAPGAEAAYEIQCRGGLVSDAQAAPGNIGTTVEVRNLFFNTPARRKFLRGASTESGHISEMFLRLALPYPQVSFKLLSGGRTTLDLPATTMEQRLLAAWPESFHEQRLALDVADAEIQLCGLVGLPALASPTTKHQYLYLNSRHIRDRYLGHALKESYRGLMEPGRQPAAILLLSIPAADVDVNVHPTKAEVRFRDSGRVHGLVLSAIREKLLGSDLTPLANVAPVDAGERQDMRSRLAAFLQPGAGGKGEPLTPALSPEYRGEGEGATGGPPVPLRSPEYGPEGSGAPVGAPAALGTADGAEREAAAVQANPSLSVAPATTIPATSATRAAVAGPYAALSPKRVDPAPAYAVPQALPLPVSGHPLVAAQARLPALQFHNTYLVTESEDGLVIIDQHALHERIMYQDLLGRLSHGPLESQRLLIPPLLRASARQMALLEQIQPLLQKLGIELSAFGPDTVAVQSFPTFLDRLDPERFVQELLDRGEQELLDLNQEELLHELLDMMACKAAVKAGDPLTAEEIQSLLARGDLVDRSSNCPHGRPTTLRLSLRDLEKQFKRTGF